MEALSRILTIGRAARTRGNGNCMEQSAIAFGYLYQKGVKPVDYMMFEADGWDHGWLVIGRAEGSDPADLGTWGPDAVWCDPWGAPGGLCFTINDLLENRPVGGGNEFHHAIAATGGRRIDLNALTIQAGQPSTWYRSQ